MVELGPTTQAVLTDPAFSSILWKMTPASLAVRLSGGRWFPWPFLQLLSRKLVDVAVGKCRRLIVVVPPRSGKSLLVSHWFPVWYLENFPENRVILCSYEMDFASRWGGMARDTVSSHQDELNIRFKSGTNTKNPPMHHWETDRGGAMMCAGVGGPITGKGANLLILDDPIKNEEEASSFTMRDKMYDWWRSTARTRLEPGGSIVVMATRWHSDDLIGRLINPGMYSEQGERESWEVYCFPALAEPEAESYYRSFGVVVNNLRADAIPRREPRKGRGQDQDDDGWVDMLGRHRGEALCPERFTVKDFALIRGAVGERDWYALYQQRPGDEAEVGNSYYAFSEQQNCRQMDRDDDWQLVVSLDFNVDPMTAVIGQYDMGSGVRLMERAHVLEEIVIHNSNTYQMSERLVVELQKYRRGYTLDVEVYGDASGTTRSPNSSKSNWQIVQEHFSLDPSIHARFLRKKMNPNVVDRVNSVNTMFRSADGTVRLTVDDMKCPELVKDMKRVRWDLDSSGNSVGLLDKSNKDRTHVSDALGYWIHYRFGFRSRGGGRPGIMQ